MQIPNFVQCKNTNDCIQEKLFDQILMICFCLSVVNVVGNILISFPVEANFKWLFMIIFTVIIHYFKNKSIWVRYLFIIFIVLILIPLGWYNSGANNNNVIAYIFLVTIAASFLFTRFFRLSIVLLLNFVFIIFSFAERYFPDLLVEYNPNLQFFDRLFQIPLLILVTYFMLRQFSNTFYEKNELLGQLNRQLEDIAYQDDLTLVNNRSFIFERYQEAIERQRPFITLMIDLDDFSQLNHDFGHVVGDEILHHLGVSLKTYFGDFGHIARYSGDVFILLLHIDIEDVALNLKAFLDHFEAIEIIDKTKVTLSGSYDSYHETQTLDEHLYHIDKLLEEIKTSGNNKILHV